MKAHDEMVKKVKMLSDTAGESCQQNVIPPALPIELEQEIKSALEKLVKVSCFASIEELIGRSSVLHS